MSKILVVEDDQGTASEIEAALVDHGCTVMRAIDGHDGLINAISGTFDAIVLDRMLPGTLDGLGLLAALRAASVQTPVLILSALSAVDERVRGLKAGGDDYLTKPFEALELTARLDVLMRRRTNTTQETVLRVGDLEINLLTHTASRAGRAIDLLPREYQLLEYLARHSGQIVTRTMMFEEVWHYRYGEATNVIDVHISKLRKKLDLPGFTPLIRTLRGSGYVLDAAN
ncbi:response regulator transcription factor [Rhizobium lusitanum]|uniref:DNA-binding response regulator, OmpR family, contains REC and winged-helix (WHTH) domain n=1 Tax=Rhizobium lusitanum TaxID=293958 RepID=A0A1C3WDQ6_9HYPH|nr:response regulator transcription factor [Rhizobium lusitanum]SCB38242.1 DNA-binding response regulator, OmpR family, contains REC and winged-helix (wHTH) domain [Rhizobium lusitanum]